MLANWMTPLRMVVAVIKQRRRVSNGHPPARAIPLHPINTHVETKVVPWRYASKDGVTKEPLQSQTLFVSQPGSRTLITGAFGTKNFCKTQR